MAFLSAATWMDPASRAGALSKGKNKFQKVLGIELGNCKQEDANVSRGFSFLAGFEE